MTSTISASGIAAPADLPTEHRGSLGLARGTALYIAAVLGTGILVLPGLAASVAGPASIISVAAVFLLSIPLAGTFAALASRYPDPGGVASYVRRALGNTPARMAGYWFYFGVCVGAPVVGVLGAEYVVAVLGVDHSAVAWVGLAILVPPFLTNFFGVRVSGAVQLILTGLLLVVVIGVVALSVPQVDTANFQPFLPHGIGGVGTAVSLFLWAFAGWEVGTHIAGEFTNPRRVIPIATGIAVVVVGIAYLALQFVTVAVLGSHAGDSQVPLLDLVATSAPGYGRYVVAVIAAIVVLGVVNAYLGALSKLGASLGRDGDLPRYFTRGVEDGGIPRRSLGLLAVLFAVYYAIMVAQGFDLQGFILVHTSCMAAIYAFGMIAAVRLLARWSLGWWMAVISTVLTFGLLVLAGPNLLIPAALAAAAIVVGLIKRARKPKPATESESDHGARLHERAENRMSDHRARFDAEVTFINGGDLTVTDFRLDLPRADVTEEELAELFVRHLGLALVRSVVFSDVAIVQELHRGSRGVEGESAVSAAGAGHARRLVDLSHTVREGLITYPGLPAPTITPHLTRAESRAKYAPGTEFALDLITMIGNTGTYLDSPFHRYEGGGDLSSLTLETLVGLPAEVFHLQDAADRGIPASVFFDRELAGTAVLLHTGWDVHFGTDAYGTGAPYLTEAGARHLVEQGVALVGIDSLNIDDTESGGERPAHSLLLAAGIHVVEHLANLGELPARGARFTAVPPKVEGFGTFPVRAFAEV